jgi:hypothetical protein
MKDQWPNALENNEQGSDAALVLPVSPRAAKSIIRLSQALDEIARQKGAKEIDPLESMLQAYKLVASYSGVLNEAMVDEKYDGDKYKALDAIVVSTKQQFSAKKDAIRAGHEMLRSGKMDEKILRLFTDRWQFMKDTLGGLAKYGHKDS